MGLTSSVELSHKEGDEPVGYQVLAVKPDSPAANVTVLHNGIRRLEREERLTGSLIAFFDYIISLNGIRLDEDTDVFIQEIKRQVNNPVELEVFNAKSGNLRIVEMVPRSWQGVGFLGLGARFNTYIGARDNVLHVVDVVPGSPADLAGLVAEEEFLLGAGDAVFSNIAEFREYTARFANQALSVIVYNAPRDSVREISIFLTTNPWGAEGNTGLGCTLACGQIHRLPNLDSDGNNEYHVVAAPGESKTPTSASASASAARASASAAAPPSVPSSAPAPPLQPVDAQPSTSSAVSTPGGDSSGGRGPETTTVTLEHVDGDHDDDTSLEEWDSDESKPGGRTDSMTEEEYSEYETEDEEEDEEEEEEEEALSPNGMEKDDEGAAAGPEMYEEGRSGDGMDEVALTPSFTHH